MVYNDCAIECHGCMCITVKLQFLLKGHDMMVNQKMGGSGGE